MDDIAAELFGPSPPTPSDEFDKAAVLNGALVAAGFTRLMANDVIERFASTMPARSRSGCAALASACCSTAATTRSSRGAAR
jgi:hypothetical protein